ncbi:hypothetical protein E0Z10_g10264 [Xylaria hypoxylon]|uniref:Uncharacterized protein n=1 Tax=Xylaria hypoxylon TaxID=37992 RepID=A0A4Z0YID6_9PEZI|nr:hypothetical protein E0Z10_g10264 [Xylaria hypoxylon]
MIGIVHYAQSSTNTKFQSSGTAFRNKTLDAVITIILFSPTYSLEMPQTIYRRPWPTWLVLALSLPLSVAWVTLLIVQGANSIATPIVGVIDILVILIFTILDPEVTITSRKVMPDGTVVIVKRPIVGFKRLESQLGLTGGYEVRIDGFRYEPAYIRI